MLGDKKSVSESAAVEMARTFLEDYIDNRTNENIAGIVLDEAASERYSQKMRLYRLAVVLHVLRSKETNVSEFWMVRVALEKLTMPQTQAEFDTAVTPVESEFITALNSVLKDLDDLFTEKNDGRRMVWARNWLLEIAIDETNPVRLATFALYWFNALLAITQTVNDFQQEFS